MSISPWLKPEGGLVGWVANTTEAIKSIRTPDYYERTPLTPADLEHLARFELSSTDFSQGKFDNCYLVATLKALIDSPRGAQAMRGNLEVRANGATVYFYCQNDRIPITVRSVFTHGISAPRRQISWGAVVESAYARFRLDHKGRLPTMGFPATALTELTGQPTRTYHFRKLSAARRGLDRGEPVLASTVRNDPTRFLDQVDLRHQTFNAVVPALVPGQGHTRLQVRAAHVYQIQSADRDYVTLINPWEYNYAADGTILRAHGVPHRGEFTLGAAHFRALFGQVAVAAFVKTLL